MYITSSNPPNSRAQMLKWKLGEVREPAQGQDRARLKPKGGAVLLPHNTFSHTASSRGFAAMCVVRAPCDML